MSVRPPAGVKMVRDGISKKMLAYIEPENKSVPVSITSPTHNNFLGKGEGRGSASPTPTPKASNAIARKS